MENRQIENTMDFEQTLVSAMNFSFFALVFCVFIPIKNIFFHFNNT